MGDGEKVDAESPEAVVRGRLAQGYFHQHQFPGRRQGRRKIGGGLTRGLDPRGDEYFWIGPQRDEEKGLKGSDLAAVSKGMISVTPLALDLTHDRTLRRLKGIMK
jgi:broad specificity polyphosphatase/5'/3'-nucleotidase SurE